MSDQTLDDGGAAFPSEGEGHGNPKYHSPGMSLRDFFAGQALAGMCASETDGVSYSSGNVASRAYKIADAMLKERESGD